MRPTPRTVPKAIAPAASAELRRLLGGPAEAPAEAEGDDVEEATAEDIDPLESSKQHSPTAGEAYDEDEGPGPQVACQQQ